MRLVHRQCIVAAVVALRLFIPSGGSTQVAKPADDYLSGSLLDLIWFHSQGFGELGRDTAAVAPGREPIKLRIKDQSFEHGLGHHAPGEITVDLGGQYLAFEADIGIQWQTGNVGTVAFQVFVDGEKRFDSGTITEQDAARPIHVATQNAEELRLVVTDAGDGITCDCANWCNARLIPDPSAKPQPPEESVDVARFAATFTSDPNRMDGTHAGRTEEFPAEDVYLDIPDEGPMAWGGWVISQYWGRGSFGLRWLERRLLREVGLEFSGGAPPPDQVELQYWVGESTWQGKWVRVQGPIVAEGDRLIARLDLRANPDLRLGTRKIRWITPAANEPRGVRKLWALTRSRWDELGVYVETDISSDGYAGWVDIYNGAFLSQTLGGGDVGLRPGAGRVRIRYCRPTSWKADRTVLHFRLPGGDCAVSVEDLLTHDCVYVPDLRLFVSREPAKCTLAGYRKAIAGRKTVLHRVREMPDQTFAQALAAVHNPVQDNGPTMLSLACDNHKTIVQREGAVQFRSSADAPETYPYTLTPRFGSGRSEGFARRLDGGWLPIVVNEVKEEGVVYRQRTFVAPWQGRDDRPLCVVEFTVENTNDQPASASLALTPAGDAVEVRPVSDGVAMQKQGRLLAFVHAADVGALKMAVTEGSGALAGKLPARATARCFAYLPSWEMQPDERASLAGGDALLEATKAYWQRVMGDTMQVELPDRLLANVIRASQVHCLIAARSADDGTTVAPWIAAATYGPLESESQAVILGMDLLGHRDFARRAHDFFLRRYNPAGYLTTGYTLMGTGWHLWTLAEHYGLTRDDEWLRAAAPTVARTCEWIVKQRAKTGGRIGDALDPPERGLVPPGVVADWNVYAYRFFMEGHYYAGLSQAAKALAAIGYPRADRFLADANTFRLRLGGAYTWAGNTTPVVPLQDGTWVPGSPSMLYCPGPVWDFFPGEDWNRSWAGDVETGPQHLVPLGVLDADDQRVRWMTDHLEDYWFLHSGMGDYPEDKSQADWFNLGGFSKVQPYYTRMTDVYAARDEVKPFIRSYFNALPSLLNTENLSLWEHFHNQGAWNKTHETGWFLQQTRTMLVTERREELWLAPFVTSNWLQDGMVVSVRNAPTHFGPVSYRIASHVKEGYIEATIDPPTRPAPREVVIRLRHPEGKPMRRVTVNGERWTRFDAEREYARVGAGREEVTVRAEYR